MKETLTTELVRRLTHTPPARETDIWDTKQPRLVLRARPNGRHSYRVLLGRGRWYTLGTIGDLTPMTARKQARKRLGEVATGFDPQAAKRKARQPTLLAYLTDTYTPWLAAHRKRGTETAARLTATVEKTWPRVKLDELTGWQVEKWRRDRLAAGAKPSTVNRDLAPLKAMLRRAVQWGHLETYPLAKVKALPEDKIGRLRYLSESEETRLRHALAARDEKRRAKRERANRWRHERAYQTWPAYGTYTDNLTPIAMLALNTGLRFGELADLRWRDVTLARALLTVRTEAAKSDHARHIPLNAEAVAVVTASKPAEDDPDAYVFPGRDGGRLQDVKSSWMPLLKTAKIQDFRFHDLRHTFASKLVMAGVDLNTVRELLGHSDIKMTLRYAHLAPEHMAEAVAKLNDGRR